MDEFLKNLFENFDELGSILMLPKAKSSPRSPDYMGVLQTNSGQKMIISLWARKSSKNSLYLKGTVTTEDEYNKLIEELKESSRKNKLLEEEIMKDLSSRGIPKKFETKKESLGRLPNADDFDSIP